jgi:hypothetical protein
MVPVSVTSPFYSLRILRIQFYSPSMPYCFSGRNCHLLSRNLFAHNTTSLTTRFNIWTHIAERYNGIVKQLNEDMEELENDVEEFNEDNRSSLWGHEGHGANISHLENRECHQLA